MRSAITLAATIVLAALLVACEGSVQSSEPVATNQVAVMDNKFETKVVEVAAGTAVTWTWDAGRPHNVVGDGWASEIQEKGSFQHTFTAPGTFDYRCTLHGGMTGRVIVR